MERIGRSHALKRTINCSLPFFKTGNTSLRLTTRPFSSSENPLRDESADTTSNNTIIRKLPVNSNNSTSEFRPRPRAVDARSLGATRSGEGAVLRAPRLQLNRSLLRGKAGGAGGARPRGRVAAANSKARKGQEAAKRTRRKKQSDEEDGEEERDADVEAVFAEVRNRSRPKTTRYTPVQYDATALKDTWPALPIGKTASTGTVLERLSLMSRRYANGYVPPQELAKRLFEGERVLFSSEEEKAEAMKEVSKLAQQRANKLTQRKGDLIEPEDSSFVSINDEGRKALIDQLVRGNYENWQQGDVRHPVLDEVQRQLYNNETYRITGKQSEFMTKFQSLLASSQRAKRA